MTESFLLSLPKNRIFARDDDDDLNLTWVACGLCLHHLQPSKNGTDECNSLTYWSDLLFSGHCPVYLFEDSNMVWKLTLRDGWRT